MCVSACFEELAGQHGIKHVESFLSTLQVNPKGDEKGRMITWIELHLQSRRLGFYDPFCSSVCIPCHPNDLAPVDP